MKKQITFALVAMILAALLCACGASNTENTTVPSIMLSTEPVETTEATTAPVEETSPTETTIPEEATEPSTAPTAAETEPAETTAQHTHSYTSTVVAPTCTTDGYTLHKCKTCGYSYNSNTSAAYGHTFVYEIHDATTTDYGYVLHICKDCDYTFKDNYTPPISTTEHTHSYAATVTAPTCYEQGYTTYMCMTCGDSYKSDYTDTLEHNEVYTRTIAPTCENYGFDRYDCSYGCGFENAHNQVPATGHSWSEWTVTKAATTEADGIETRTCETCGATETQILTQLVEAHAHSYTAEVTSPNCTKSGYTTYTCACGDSYTSDEVSETGHDYQMPNDTATCTEPGIRTYTCAVCGYEERIEIDANGHNYSSTVFAPTCTDDGYTIYQCIYCGFCKYADFIDPAGHTWSDWVTTVDPTVDTNGEEMRTCSVCQTSENREVEKLASDETEPPATEHEHSYTCTVTAPSCTANGYSTYTCACSDSYTADEVAAVGHSWSEWETTVEATAETEGTKVRTCNVCGESESQQIAKKPSAPASTNIYDLVNAARAENGLSPLTYYAGGQQAADIRVAEIAQYFSHTRPNGSDCFTVQGELGLSMFFCGENIATGYSTTTAAMNAWMNSPGHRANILSTYFTHIAVATDGYYWGMLFFS